LEARGHRSKISTNKVSALPQRWLRGSCLQSSRSVVEVSAFRSGTCLHAALVRFITENIPTVESVWRPVASGPRPPPTRSLLCHRIGCVDPAWSPVDHWWRSQRFGTLRAVQDWDQHFYSCILPYLNCSITENECSCAPRTILICSHTS